MHSGGGERELMPNKTWIIKYCIWLYENTLAITEISFLWDTVLFRVALLWLIHKPEDLKALVFFEAHQKK